MYRHDINVPDRMNESVRPDLMENGSKVTEYYLPTCISLDAAQDSFLYRVCQKEIVQKVG